MQQHFQQHSSSQENLLRIVQSVRNKKYISPIFPIRKLNTYGSQEGNVKQKLCSKNQFPQDFFCASNKIKKIKDRSYTQQSEQQNNNRSMQDIQQENLIYQTNNKIYITPSFKSKKSMQNPQQDTLINKWIQVKGLNQLSRIEHKEQILSNSASKDKNQDFKNSKRNSQLEEQDIYKTIVIKGLQPIEDNVKIIKHCQQFYSNKVLTGIFRNNLPKISQNSKNTMSLKSKLTLDIRNKDFLLSKSRENNKWQMEQIENKINDPDQNINDFSFTDDNGQSQNYKYDKNFEIQHKKHLKSFEQFQKKII